MKDKYLQRSIMWQLIIAAAIGLGIYLVLGTDIILSFGLGIISWCLVLGLNPKVRSQWFIWPQANFVFVLEKGMTAAEELHTNKQLTKLQETNTMRVVRGPKLTGKTPFEKPIEGKAIYLKRSIGIGETLTIKLQDNSVHKIKWWTVLFVINSDVALINLARHTEKQAIERYTRNFSSFLQGECARLKDTAALYEQIIPIGDPTPGNSRPMGELQKKFNSLYGGAGEVIDAEIEIGFQTGDPLCEIELEKDLLNAFQSTTIAASQAEAIKKYTQAGVHPDIAANMVETSSGKEKPATVTRQIFDLPPGIRSVSIVPITETRS